ncbi:uncharacterized protein LOC112345505 [Selaginella moellendorffii]|uniref:uncharacterized protein LOC112345505 n=1 Tax=Selaginella moellendorffii TaxID=88036 RepID=UPI000D1CBE20|nr:uncharacterized protein LOC112345505 [Selaginella moellendorffii]|eukprot:XP_024528154.1 uncharacterized protein LOC112345505 [Selaginella moellendorffii]
MENTSTVRGLLLVLLVWKCSTVARSQATQPWPSYRSSYSRIHDAQKQCPFSSSLVSSQQQGGDDDQGPDPKWVIQNELSFQNGDWFQEPKARSSPVPRFTVNGTRPQLLSSFWITDVNLRSKAGAVKISAVLQLAISAFRSIGYFTTASESSESSPEFASLTVLLEGVYFETQRNDRGVCMVGCTVFNGTRICDLFLELHFPRRLSLESREVRGSLTSKSGIFDDVSIASQLGAYSKYEFDDGRLVKPACNPSMQQMPSEGITVYTGNRGCSILMEILTGQWIHLSSSGPFALNATRMQVLDIRCIDIPSGANVSAIFRATPSVDDESLSLERKGLSDGLAFAAEGVYSSFTGEICMLGCRNKDLSSSSPSCDVRVSMFVPLSLSIAQRDVLFGKMTSLGGESAYRPTNFGLFVPLRGLPSEVSKKLSYSYSRAREGEKLARSEEMETSLADRVKQSMLKFPRPSKDHSMQELGQDLAVFSQLINENPANPSGSIQFSTRTMDIQASSKTIDIQVLSIEDIILMDWNSHQSDDSSQELGDDEKDLSKGDEETIRVAVEVIVTNVAQVSAEGVYVPRTGRIHLVGCLNNISGSDVLMDSQPDCNTTIVIQYPPRNTQWLVNPTLRMKIASSRASSDPSFFPPMHLESFPILYRDQLREILSRKTLEAVLSAITLSVMLICIVLQLIHVKKSAESVPFISLLMLGVQAFGYSIPLITGAEALFARLTSRDDPAAEAGQSSAIKDTGINQMVLYLVKLLSLAAFLLMLRLCQKVVRYRIRLATKFPLEPRRVPSDVKPAKIFLLVHTLGFLTVLAFHYALQGSSRSSEMMRKDSQVGWDGKIQKPEQDWMRELKEYGGLVEDLFLLPQVIATSVWEIRGKPLARAYYMGMTALRLLPHVYNALTRPLFNPYFADESLVYANPRMDFYSRVGDVVIPVMAVLLAAMVYAQQRWNELKWGRVLRQGSSKLLRYGSKLYERLPSSKLPSTGANFEAEMMPGNGNVDGDEDRRTLMDAEKGGNH